MSPLVNAGDLVDAHDLAEILGLSHPDCVTTYLRRCDDMARPAVARCEGRARLWVRQ